MNKTGILLIAAISLPTLVNAATGLTFGDSRVQAKPRLVIALQDNHPTTGTDSGNTNFPNAGLNTKPTENTGTETNAQESKMPIVNTPNTPTNTIVPTPNPNDNKSQ